MRPLPWVFLALIGCAGGTTRERTTTIRDSGTTVEADATATESDAGSGCAEQLCVSADESQVCCCPNNFICARSLTTCECLPPDVPDSGVNEPVDAGSVDSGFADSGARDTGPRPDGGVDGPPTYSGTCPTFRSGRNDNFMSSGQARSFELRLPSNPQGAGVVFAWHWWQGQPDTAMNWTGLTGVQEANRWIVISPYTASNAGGQWRNADIQLFDDLLGCLYQQYNVDLDRIYTHGHSMGALWSSLLVVARANRLAAATVLSGGLQSSQYRRPASPIPVLLVWGGPTDTYGNFSFDSTTRTFSTRLQADGHLVVECEGTFGHQLPPDQESFVRFLNDHRRGQPEPYANGLPSNWPGWCRIP